MRVITEREGARAVHASRNVSRGDSVKVFEAQRTTAYFLFFLLLFRPWTSAIYNLDYARYYILTFTKPKRKINY